MNILSDLNLAKKTDFPANYLDNKNSELAGNYMTLVIFFLIVMIMVGYRRYMGFVDLNADDVEARYSNEESKFVELGGLQQNIRLHYRDEGLSPEKNPDAPVIFLLHGIMASLHTWDGWVDELRNDFRIIRIDIPGFGLTGPYKDGIYNVERFVDAVDQLSDHLGIQSFSLAGNSMGGFISWRFEAAHPNKVERLILLDSAGYSFKLPKMLKLLVFPILKTCIPFLTPRFLVTRTVKEVYGDSSKVTDAVIDRYHALMLREGNRKAVVTVLEVLLDINAEKIKQVKAPTLILWGERDLWIPVKLSKKFMADLKNPRLITYPGVGHIPMEEIPQKSAEDAKAFLLSSGS